MSRRPPPAPNAPDADFGLLTFAGLGELAAKELAVGARRDVSLVRLPNHDLVHCRLALADVARLATLRTVEDVFVMLGRPQRLAGPRDLARLNAAVTAPAVLAALGLRNRLFHPAKPHRPSYHCFVKADADGPVRRRDVAEHVERLLARAFPKWKPADPAAVELWAFLAGGELRLGLRLSDNRLRYRGREPVLREGALRPTIAAALIQVAALQPGETVVDPMCGGGTLLAEGWARQPAASFSGGDLDPTAVDLARQLLQGTPVTVQAWDARELPLPARTVNCFLCNLPFGKQYASPAAVPQLYADLIAHWLTILKPRGRLVLLTAAGDALEAALARQPGGWRVAAKVKVLGVWARVYRVTAGGAVDNGMADDTVKSGSPPGPVRGRDWRPTVNAGGMSCAPVACPRPPPRGRSR